MTPGSVISSTRKTSMREIASLRRPTMKTKVYPTPFPEEIPRFPALHVSVIRSKSTVRERGVYAPMTATGDLFVNNIYASCHNVVRMNTLAQTFLQLATKAQEKVRTSFFRDEIMDSDEILAGRRKWPPAPNGRVLFTHGGAYHSS